MPRKTYDPEGVNVSQCLACGCVFDGRQYTDCPKCSSTQVANNLDIHSFYQDRDYSDEAKLEREVRFYLEMMADGDALTPS